MKKISRLLFLHLVCFVIITTAQDRPPMGKLDWPSPDEAEPSYTLPGTFDKATFRAPDDDYLLGEYQEVEVYEPEHHIYKVPFRYKNVTLDYWAEYSDKGVEITAELGSITIVEEKPIVAVTIVGSGCSTPSYNTVEWWADGESIRNVRGQLVKRQRVDNLMGQHAAFVQGAFSQKKDFKSLEQAQAHIDQMQRVIYAMTQGYYLPGSVMHGLYENTVYFRVGDHTRFKIDKNANSYANRVAVPGKPVKKVVIRCGGLDYEDPGTERSRYPADYAIRLVEVVVKK